MTEIPEHLLKRSRERRAAIGQGADDTPAAADPAAGAAVEKTTTSAPVAAAPSGPAGRTAAAAPAAPKPIKPDPAYVVAAKQRRKVPFWAMATLSLMPVWGFMYIRALTDSGELPPGPLAEGAEVYGSCSSCHGGAGGGGTGYQFSEGEVLKTFPHIEDQLRYVYYGTEAYNIEGVEIYGNPERDGGPHIAGVKGPMPAQGGQLTDEEIVAVVCHERYTLGGADPTSEEYAAEFEAWCSPDAPLFEEIAGGAIVLNSDDAIEPVDVNGESVDVATIGSKPIPGSPPK